MSYIGRGIDSIDNISTLDNLSFNGSSTTFNLTQNSVAFTPVSADALQIQIDGVIQSGNYTVSGSTVTFDFTPSGSSVCNGIKHFGVGVMTSVSDGAVTEAKLGSSAVTTAKLGSLAVTGAKLNTDVISAQTALGATPADTDELLVSDAGVLKRVDYSYLKSVAGTNSFSVTGSGTQSSIADATWTKITFDSENWDTDDLFASDKFTATDAGKYFFTANVCLSYDSAAGPQFAGRFYKNGSGDSQTKTSLTFTSGTVNTVNARVTGILNLAASDYVELYGYADVGSGVASAPAARSMMGFRVA